MFRNECVRLDSFKNTNIKITCRVDEWTRLIERMMNYDELFENDQSIQKIRTSHYSTKLLRLPPIILARKVVVRVIDRSQSFDCFV